MRTWLNFVLKTQILQVFGTDDKKLKAICHCAVNHVLLVAQTYTVCVVWCGTGHNNNNNNNNRIQRRYLRFFTISSQRCEPSPICTLKWPRRTCAQIMCNTSSACHVQHVVLRASWYEGTAQLLSLTELKSHLFELYFVG